MSNAALTTILLICNGFLLGFGILVTVVGLHFDAMLETFAWVLVGLFQLLLMALYSLSRREEENVLTGSIQNVERLLMQLGESRPSPKANPTAKPQAKDDK
jgi:hypothetical protein